MTEREALLAAVCEHPDDDTPRLVFADWLDEHGEPDRAEFIRVQVELARGAGEREAELNAREQALLGECGEHWLEPVRPFATPNFAPKWWEFGRGFVERVVVDGEDGGGFFAAAPDLFRQFPLRALWFTELQDYEPISRWPGLGRVPELFLEGSILCSIEGVGELFRSPDAAGLRALHLNGYDDNGHLDLAAVQELAGPTALGGLRHLDLYFNWSAWQGDPPDWVHALVGAELLPQLDRLDLAGTWMRGDGVEIVAGSPRVAGLTHLDLSSNEIGERGARALIDSPHLGRLRVLDLRETDEDIYDDRVTPATRARLVERFGDRVRLDRLP
jgi:uncharacterized protein (TIGR02996 family)